MTTDTTLPTEPTEKNTEITTTTAVLSLAAGDLARILEQTAPHRGEYAFWPKLAVTRFDADGRHLHADFGHRYRPVPGELPRTTQTWGRITQHQAPSGPPCPGTWRADAPSAHEEAPQCRCLMR